MHIRTNLEFSDREMDEEAYQESFNDDLDAETDLDFSEDFLAEHEPSCGAYESIENEIAAAVDEAAEEIIEEDDEEIRQAEGLTEYVDIGAILRGE